MVPVYYCDHLVGEAEAGFFAFLQFVACVLSVNPSLAVHDMPCLSKQCRSRSVGF